MSQMDRIDVAPGHARGELVTCAGCGRTKHRADDDAGALILGAAGWTWGPRGEAYCPDEACRAAWDAAWRTSGWEIRDAAE